jgi:protocatechuate 3,4-dioxygenase beta subunit
MTTQEQIMSDVSIQWLIVFVDASVKAVLVALVVATGLALLRVRDSNLRHRVWTGVLCGMLLLPALTPIVPALRLPFTINPEWFAVLDRVDDDAGREQIPDKADETEKVAAAEPAVDQPQESFADAAAPRDNRGVLDSRSDWPGVEDRWPGDFPGSQPRALVGQDDIIADDASTAAVAEPIAALKPEPEPAKANSPPAAARQTVSQAILASLPLVCWSLWIIGSLALGLRLLAGLWMAQALRRASRLISMDELQAVIGPDVGWAVPTETPDRGGQSPICDGGGHSPPYVHVPVSECPLIRVPLTLGILRPQILLPLDWTDWPVEKLRAVLAHERTHAERGDCALALLAEVNRCLYWFHPLAWWLQRQLASLAEAACDDAAIGSTGDRASYARHLLEVAATARAHRGRLVAGSVSMARRSTVEIRINSILDFTRPLSQRLTRGMALILLGTIVPLIALAAALRPDDGRKKSTDAVPSTQYEIPSTESPAPNEFDAKNDEPGGRNPADTADAEVRRNDDAKQSTDSATLSTEYSVLSTQSPAPDEPAANPDANAPFTFAGTVVDDRRQPVAGAKVSLSYFRKNPAASNVIPALKTDDRGKFEFSVKTSDFSDAADSGGAFWTDAGFVAVKDGFGFAFAPAAQFETSGRIDSELADWQRNQIARQSAGKAGVLTLVRDDVPIRGRILNADGQPVVGARIEAFEFWEGKDGTLDAWETAAEKEDASTATTTRQLRRFVKGHQINFNFRGGMGSAPATRVTSQGNLFWGSRTPIIPPVTCGADGWFTLKGVGRERIVELLISGPGVETTEQRVRTRAGDVVKLGLNRPIPHAPLTFVYHPNEFTLVSGPSVPVTGRVTDIKSGQPLAGIGVQSTGQWKGVVTDAEGKYRLEGLPLGLNELLISPPAGSRHLAGGVHLTTTAATPPLMRDITLTPGVLVRGRAVDETTGKPVRGNLQYFAYKSNPLVTESDSLHQGNTHTEFRPDAEGRFEIPVLPGQGILALWAGTQFPDAVGADAIDCPRQNVGGNSIVFDTSPTWCITSAHNLLVPINPRSADDELTINLALRSGMEIPGRILAPDGQPLDNYRIFGARRHVVWPLNSGKTFKVEGYNPSETRRIIVYHEERDLVGYHDLTGEPPKELEIRLQPAATLVGRVLDADGSGGFPQVNLTNHQLDSAFLKGNPSAAELEHGVLQIEATTDSNGRFKLKGIVPGLKYTAHLNFFPPLLKEKKLKSSLQGPIFADVTAEVGEAKDLGDLVLELNSGKPAKPVKSEKPAATGVDGLEGRPTKNETVTVKGIVLKPDGKPAAGATIRAAAPLWAMMASIVGSDFKSPVSETQTDSQGKFTISFPTQPFGDVSRLEEHWREIWKQTTVAAALPGFGPAWATYEEIGPDQPVTLRLVDDVPIHGKVVDLEGRPVAGAKIKLGEPRAAKGDDLSAWIEGVKAGELPWTVVDKAPRSAELRVLGLPDVLTTDAEGTFELRGLGRDRCLPLTFEGEFVAYRNAMVVTRSMPALQRKISNPPFESFESVFGADFTFTAEPARPIEGIVRDAKTGEALAGVSVDSYKLVGYPYSNNRVLKTKTDKQGRFRLIGMPKGAGNRLLLLPNDDQPYFMREVDVPDPVGLEPVKMEIDLHQGIWIGGRVTDKATGEPVPAVKMYYIPLLSNEYAQKIPEFRSDENVDGDQWRYVTKPDGTYRLVGLPGRAIVGADSTLKSFRRGIGYDAIDAPKSNGWFQTYRNPVNPGPTWPTMMREINPAVEATDVTLDFELDPGKSVKIRVVDRDGKPVTGVSGRGVTTGGSLKASPQSVVIAQNFGPQESRTMLLRHGERKIGRMLTITPAMVDQGEVSVELLPVSIVTGQLRRSQGGPVSGMDIEPRILPDGLSDERPRGAVTNAEGKFEVELLPGCRYALDGRGGGFDYATLTDELTIEPGETKDLGTLELGADGKVVKPSTAKSTNGETPERDVGRPSRPPANGQTQKTTQSNAKGDDLEGRSTKAGDSMAYRGRVVDPDGKPFAGARVCVVGVYGGFAAGVKNVPVAETKSRADGSFEVEFSNATLERAAWGHSLIDALTTIVALGDGFGPAFAPLSKLSPGGEVLLKLVRDDIPVTGRILDLEGRPVVGAKISVRRIAAPQQGDLGGFLKLIADGEVRTFAVFDSLVVLPEADNISFPVATSDAQGRFRLTGIGRERYAEFAVSGPGIAYGEASVVTRPGAPLLMQEADPRMPIAAKVARRLFGAEIEFVALPSRPVTGLVRDTETGKPMPGVRVFNWRFASSPLNGVVVIDAFTDESGRFRLSGMPVGEGNLVMIVPPSNQPYFSQQAAVAVDAKLDPIPVEIELHRGIWITGRVTDKVTGDPVSAVVHWLPFRTNEFAQKRTPEFGPNGNRDGWTNYPIAPDGTFRVLGLPGKALVAASVNTSYFQGYRIGVGSEKFQPANAGGPQPGMMGPPGMLPMRLVWRAGAGGMRTYHSFQEIDVPETADSFECKVELDPGEKLRVSVVDPEGKPITGCEVGGHLRPLSFQPVRVDESAFDLGALVAKEKRVLFINHQEQRVGKVAVVEYDPNGPRDMKISLESCATVMGRITAPDGDHQAIKKLLVMARLEPLIGRGGHRQMGSCEIDAEGRFKFESLPVGCEYVVGYEGELDPAKPIVPLYQSKPFTVKSGEKLDLGDVALQVREPKLQQQQNDPTKATDKDVGRPSRPPVKDSTPSNAKSVDGLEGRPTTRETSADGGTAIVVHGRVTGPDGKAEVKAHVAVIGTRSRQERGGDLPSRSEVLAEDVTGDDGRFELKLSGISSKTHSWANVIARADNSGLAWRRIDPAARETEVSLELPAEQVIRGRLIDIEGQPAGAVRIAITSIVSSSKTSPRGEGVGFHKFGQPPQAWPPSVIADSNGGFVIHGIPADYGVYLKVDGTDRFAPQEIALNTGAPEQRPQNDATYRSLVRNVKPGEEAVLPLAPAQIFEGTVRYADTGEPAPYARLTIWASQQESSGSMISVPGKADAEGRYRINPNPGVRFGITAYPPDGVPYLIRATRDIKHKEDSFVKRVDITLPRGVLVRGQVVESTTKAPVAGAAIQYVPERTTSDNAPNDVVTGWQGIQLSGVDGAFEIAVLPGPGTLLVNGPNGNFVSQEIGSQQLSNGRPGGERNYAHAIHRVAPEANANPLDVTIDLKPGTTVSGRITTGSGEPVEKALLITRLNLRPSELTWRGFPLEALGGRFELSGLADGMEYPVHFLDAKNRLGATLMLKAEDQAPTVVLVPCGEAVATFVDAEGKPITAHRPLLEIVVTPGSARLDLAALRLGILAADAAYVANLDRANYWDRLRTDDDGRATFPALIPGANYRIITYTKGMPVILKTFVGESAKTLDLGKITIEVPKEE